MNRQQYIKVTNEIKKTARPLDKALFDYYFEGHNSKNIIDLLKVYQNEDGGFGNGLEPDTMNKNSSPGVTARAIEIMMDIDCFDKEICDGIIKYLEANENEQLTYPLYYYEDNDYISAPWWKGQSDVDLYNPTVTLLGFVCMYGNGDFKQRCISRLNILLAKILECDNIKMHSLKCLINLVDLGYILDVIVYQKIIDLINKNLVLSPEKWEEYCLCPSMLFSGYSCDSSVFSLYKDDLKKEMNYLIKQLDDVDIWSINWKWDCENYFAISNSYWKCIQAIKYLNIMKRLKMIKIN